MTPGTYTLAQDEGKTDKVDEKGESTAQQQSTDRQDEGTDMPKVSTTRTKLSTDKVEEGTAEPEPRERASDPDKKKKMSQEKMAQLSLDQERSGGKVSSPEGDYLVVYRVNGNFRAFNYLIRRIAKDVKETLRSDQDLSECLNTSSMKIQRNYPKKHEVKQCSTIKFREISLEPDVHETLPKPNMPNLELNDQKFCEEASNQMEKIFQIFQDLLFDISFADALLLMPRFAPTIKNLL
ncbi:hypothetical protein Tco_0886231 [Tanacetum coccineum]